MIIGTIGKVNDQNNNKNLPPTLSPYISITMTGDECENEDECAEFHKNSNDFDDLMMLVTFDDSHVKCSKQDVVRGVAAEKL
ncbi:hypothetical protein B9Z55_015175 [Caenorhabditis nigoni]|uniref:Uncharacterized protein n=1 Tax=Caenorhabditis nigoni TaxID=1611254 RepID=A0A2G5U925_9PELO|nr:hypothetical protein B9Z55_015175 [Caenorhabditis nigoni]